MKHIHAELIKQYAEDAMLSETPWENWEFLSSSYNEWTTLNDHPAWNSDTSYRRKQKFININGYKVPEPLREIPKEDDMVYMPSLGQLSLYYSYKWSNNNYSYRCFQRGLMHSTKEAAIQHAEALLSFTEMKE